MLDNVNQTHLTQASGKRVIQKLVSKRGLRFQVHVDHGLLHSDVGPVAASQQNAARCRSHRSPPQIRRPLSARTHVEHFRYL